MPIFESSSEDESKARREVVGSLVLQLLLGMEMKRKSPTLYEVERATAQANVIRSLFS